jgi:hypothetical protein
MDLEHQGHVDATPAGVASDGLPLGLTGAGAQLVSPLELERMDQRELDALDGLIHLD